VNWGTLVVVGGGCYGTFYARQLRRARAEGKVFYRRLMVVDCDPACQATRDLEAGEDWELVVESWTPFFDQFLPPPPGSAAPPEDAIVPSPLMPHLMYEWLVRRARGRWPGRSVETVPLSAGPGTPYDVAAPDGTRYVSHADWICPTHCIEPAICPVTRAPRTWEMRDTLIRLAPGLKAAGPVLFSCRHEVYGVGLFPVREVREGDATVSALGAAGAATVLVGTISSCHGAVNLLRLGPA